MKKKLKVALVHDFLTQYGGAERFLEALLRIFSEWDVTIYTLVFRPEAFPKNWRSYPIQTIAWDLPKIDYYPQLYAPYLLTCIERLSLVEYDLVFSSDLIFAKCVVCPPHVTHISYQHTPASVLYPYLDENEKKGFVGAVTAMQKSFLRNQEFISAQRTDRLLTNSHVTAERIEKFYRRKPEVVYSFVDIPPESTFSSVYKVEGEYFLCLSRLVGAKKLELVIEACNELHEPLVVVGEGSERQHLEEIAGPTIRFTGYVSDNERAKLIGRAKALIVPGIEDLGLVPLEVMAYGKPVIAYRAGGVTETVVDKVTGCFFDEQSASGVIHGIKLFNEITFDSTRCRERASAFSRDVFEAKIKSIVDEALTNR